MPSVWLHKGGMCFCGVDGSHTHQFPCLSSGAPLRRVRLPRAHLTLPDRPDSQYSSCLFIHLPLAFSRNRPTHRIQFMSHKISRAAGMALVFQPLSSGFFNFIQTQGTLASAHCQLFRARLLSGLFLSCSVFWELFWETMGKQRGMDPVHFLVLRKPLPWRQVKPGGGVGGERKKQIVQPATGLKEITSDIGRN